MILAREKANGTPVDAILLTLGGQTGLNTGMACFDKGILTKYGVEMIGANRDAIHRGEDRQVFKDLMIKIGLSVPRSGVVHSLEEGRKVLDDIGLPLIIRPAFTLGEVPAAASPTTCRNLKTIVQLRHRRFPRLRSPHRTIRHRLEGIRAGSDARPQR